jgi:transposase-like protein
MTELENDGVGHPDSGCGRPQNVPDAISPVFPHTQIQTCIVHLIRHSMQFASWKDRKALGSAFRPIHRAQ